MIVKRIYCPEIIYSTSYPYFTSKGLVVWVLDSQYRVHRFKNSGWLQADSDFDPSLVNQMKIRKSWNLVTQRKLSPCSGSVSQRQLNHGFCPTQIIMGGWGGGGEGGGGLNLKIWQNFVGQNFFLDLWVDKPLWESWNNMRGIIFITIISLFHFSFL